MKLVVTKVSMEAVHVKCPEAGINQEFLIEDLPDLINNLENLTKKP